MAAIHSGADRCHGADQVIAGDEGKLRLAGVPTQAHGVLGEGDPGGFHGHQHLSRRRWGEGAAAHLESVGLHLSGQDDLGCGNI